MARALGALFLAPLVASGMFGMLAIIVLPYMLVITLLIALPLFFALQKLGWLAWWHAVLAGGFCGLCFVFIDTVLLRSPADLDRLISSNNVFFIWLGALIGFAFWWIGIFKNPAFRFVPARFPKSVLVVVPVAAAAGFLLHQALQPSFHQGRVLAVLKEPPSSYAMGVVSVRLSSGATVNAEFGTTWPRSMIAEKCFHLTERWSTLRVRRLYELASPFGGGVDDC